MRDTFSEVSRCSTSAAEMRAGKGLAKSNLGASFGVGYPGLALAIWPSGRKWGVNVEPMEIGLGIHPGVSCRPNVTANIGWRGRSARRDAHY